MWPPGAVRPQHPRLVDPSSQVMMMMPFCENHVELITGPMLLDSQVSPALVSWFLELVKHGEPVLVSLCMLSQLLGVIQTKSGALAPFSVDTSELAPGYGSTPSVLRLPGLHQPADWVELLLVK